MSKGGMDEIVVAETSLSDVDGAAGRLVIRGRTAEQVADGSPFERTAASLLDGLVPGLPRGPAFDAALGAARVEAFGTFAPLLADLAAMPPIEAMRAGIAQLPDGDDAPTALRLLAAPAVLLGALERIARREAPLPPDPALAQAADLLRMAGLPHGAEHAGALDAYLSLVSDHGLNASTFAARVAASTRAGLTSAVLAGISALKGPLHGGAPGPVIEMLDAIGASDRAADWLEAAIARGDRLMGFGHRIYRVRDPRADALKSVVRRLARSGEGAGRLSLAEAVEAAALDLLRRAKPDRPLDTNVEFYTALLLEALGFRPDAFTCVFAAGRVAGWLAHAREQVASGRLIRPQSRYVGPPAHAA